MIVASVLTGNRPNARIARVSPSSHTIFVERQSENKLVKVPDRSEVLPGEPIRISVHGTGKADLTQSHITLASGYTGQVSDSKTIRSNLAGNAWWDTTAPMDSGPVVITAAARHGSFWGGGKLHSASIGMTVAGDAPPPPRPTRQNTNQGFWAGGVGQFVSSPFRFAGRQAKSLITQLLIGLLVVGGIAIIGLIVVAKVFPKVMPQARVLKAVRNR